MKHKLSILSIGFVVLATAFCGCGSAKAPEGDGELTYCLDKVCHTLDELRDSTGSIDYTMMPRDIAAGSKHWNCRRAGSEEWCSGFWPGILWYAYENSGDSAIMKEADRFTSELEDITHRPVFDHDLGFLMLCSYGNGYRLTGNPAYRQVIINAADSLAELYNPVVGTILAWPRNVEMFGGHNTIIDTMMNLELLFWAANNGGNPYLYDIAVTHAETTMRHHFRPDYSCYHVAVYDQQTGEFMRGCNHQGYSDDSMWARGQAWAIYGYTVVYRETKDPKFLDFVQNVADRYLSLLPDDMVPYWDFNDPAIPQAPRDASAACIVASALIELSGYVDDEKSKRYIEAVDGILASLSSDRYRSNDSNSSFLLHSTGHRPAGKEIDASIIYADYYYLEALTRHKNRADNHDEFLALSKR